MNWREREFNDYPCCESFLCGENGKGTSVVNRKPTSEDAVLLQEATCESDSRLECLGNYHRTTVNGTTYLWEH